MCLKTNKQDSRTIKSSIAGQLQLQLKIPFTGYQNYKQINSIYKLFYKLVCMNIYQLAVVYRCYNFKNRRKRESRYQTLTEVSHKLENKRHRISRKGKRLLLWTHRLLFVFKLSTNITNGNKTNSDNQILDEYMGIYNKDIRHRKHASSGTLIHRSGQPICDGDQKKCIMCFLITSVDLFCVRSSSFSIKSVYCEHT